MLQWLAQFLTAPIVNGFLNAYKAKLAAAKHRGVAFFCTRIASAAPPAVTRHDFFIATPRMRR